MAKEYSSVPVVGEVIPINAGDVESAMAYWTEDATVTLIGFTAGIQDSFQGKAKVCTWLNGLIARHCEIKVSVIRVQNNTVTTRTHYWDDLTRQVDNAPLVMTEVYVVNNGLIANLTSTLSPKSRLRF